MSTTIDSLDIQISTSVGQSAQKIQELANALGNLKNQGKIGAATSAMKSLAKALDVLNPALNGMNPAKLQQLRAAMSSLSGIQKASGLTSVVKQLKEIPNVIASLDTSKLAQFESQMERLASALRPLATEIEKIGNGFSKLPKYVGQAVTVTNKMAKASNSAAAATKKHSGEIDSSNLNIMTAVSNLESLIHVIQMAGGAVKAVVADAMQWDGIQYRFGRAFGEDAEEVLAYAKKINDELGINMQQFMQYSSLYGSLLSGFGMAQEKVTTISVGLTELSYDIWAAYNDRFKSLEEASEAVRSAITGEIEPIRNAGIALTEASLQEYLEQIGMATVSIENLSEAQKAEVRYAAMMEAAMNQGIVGTYAGEMQTAEGAVRSLTQSWKGFVQALGSLFIPVIQAIIPYLTAFVNLLYDAVAAVASFFGIAFFEIDWGDGGKNMSAGSEEIKQNLSGGAAAAKKIRDYTMGFDELNIIQPPDENSGGGGGGGSNNGWTGLDLDTLWDESVFAKASKQVDELKQKIKDWFAEWKEEIIIIGGALAGLGMATMLSHLGTALSLGEGFLGVMGTIKKLAGTAIVITLQYSFVHELLENFVEEGSWRDYIAALVTTAIGSGILYSQWGKKGLVVGLAVTAVASFAVAFEDGSIDTTEEAVTGLTGLATAGGALAIAWPKIKLFADGIVGFFKAAAQMAPEVGWLAALFPKTASILSVAATWVTQTLVPAITSAITTGLGAIASVLGVSVGWAAAIVAAVIAAIVGAIWAIKNWDKVTEFFTETVPTWFSGVKEAVSTWWKNFDFGKTIRNAMGSVKDWFSGIRDDVNEYWDGVIQDIDDIDWKGLGRRVGEKVGKAFKNAKDWFSGVKESWNTFWREDLPKFFTEIVPDLIEDIKTSWNKFWKEEVPKFLTNLANFFLVELPAWKKEMKQIGEDIVLGILDGIVGSWKEFWKGVGEWIDGFVEGFKDALEINSPSKLFTRIGQYIVEGLLNGISSKWEELKKWYNSNVAPKLTLDYWKNKFNNISQGIKDKWTEAKNWWNNNKPSLATVQANIASVKEKLSSAWTTAKEWWDEKRSGLSSISVTVSSIKDKIKTAWDTAKEWLNKQSMKLDIKTPHFSVGWNYNISSFMAGVADFLFDRKAIPYIDVQWYAQGGFPNTGEMFVAREAGPELVGKIGNRTTVANNDQIVEAVSRGVYSAVVEAMRGYSDGQSGQEINLYLDGKQITAAVEKHQKSRGATLMTGGMAYGY